MTVKNRWRNRHQGEPRATGSDRTWPWCHSRQENGRVSDDTRVRFISRLSGRQLVVRPPQRPRSLAEFANSRDRASVDADEKVCCDFLRSGPSNGFSVHRGARLEVKRVDSPSRGRRDTTGVRYSYPVFVFATVAREISSRSRPPIAVGSELSLESRSQVSQIFVRGTWSGQRGRRNRRRCSRCARFDTLDIVSLTPGRAVRQVTSRFTRVAVFRCPMNGERCTFSDELHVRCVQQLRARVVSRIGGMCRSSRPIRS